MDANEMFLAVDIESLVDATRRIDMSRIVTPAT